MYTKSSFQGGSAVKNLPANIGDAGDVGSTPWLERSPGRGIGNPTHSSILAWRIPWTEEPGGLQSQDLRVRHDLATEHAGTYTK